MTSVKKLKPSPPVVIPPLSGADKVPASPALHATLGSRPCQHRGTVLLSDPETNEAVL